MLNPRRICLDLHINSRPVAKFTGEKTYVSTGDSEDMAQAEAITFYNRPSRANVSPIPNDVIFAKMANTDKTFLIDNELSKNIYSTGFFDVSSTKILPRFLYYLIQSDEFDSYKNAYSEGTTQISISDKRLKKIKITYETDRNKQQQIADYLDKKVGVIDRLVVNISQQIEDLKQYKKNLISENVIKCPNKNVTLKSSRIEYIGKIPCTWNVKRLRFIATCQNGISKSGECFGSGSPFVSYGDVYNNYVLPETVEGLCEVTDSEKVNYSVRTNDIFFTRTSETIEEIAMTCVCKKTIKNATFAGFLIRVRPFTDELLVDFSKYYFASDIHRKFFVKEMNIVTRASLSQNLLKNLPVLIPSKEEQQLIVDYLDKKCGTIDNMIQIKQQKIKELKEYKKSLIYECVTGKKEVLQ